MSYKRRQLKTKYQNNSRIFVAVPEIIYNNTDLNATDKIVLALIHGFKSKTGWNSIKTSTIANYLNLETSTINTTIRKLVFLDLIEQRYYRARRRVFKSLLPKTTDAKSLITSDIFTDDQLSTTYKLTIGVIIASSLGENNDLGGFNFNDIETLAEELNLSVSSVYRHLNKLYEVRLIDERNFGDYLIRPKDTYSVHHHDNQKRKMNYNRMKKELDDEADEYITPEVNAALERIYNRI